jgi:hypothetical protein
VLSKAGIAALLRAQFGGEGGGGLENVCLCYHRRCEVPDKVEDAADIDLESVPPRMSVFVVQHFDTKK